MIGVARTDPTVIGRWWWTVDRWSLGAVGLLIVLGAILVAAASPPVAHRLGLGEFHFVQRHLTMLVPAIAILVASSLMSVQMIRRAGLVMLVLSLLGVAATLVVGTEIKGATRWISLPGLSLQPSEFLKPAFAVIAAWLFATRYARNDFPGNLMATVLWLLSTALLLLQPDLGMVVVLFIIWGVQFFLAGLPMLLVVALVALAVFGGVGSYFAFDHVSSRIDRFLDPTAGDNYQIERSLEAFQAGGLFGVGPGEGVIKRALPDAHADFIFAVAGEEFGLLWCLLMVALFGFVVLRACARLAHSRDLFVVLAGAGLVTMIAAQALINMGSTLHLIPTKGMTLPFISYGGSSLLATAFATGMLLALTRKGPDHGGLA
ncbi:MAG: cell division protein FtsW [Rhodospirillaceae bacterium]|nr:cell division protein FtsW [Rhodospirillaceae bacterium]